MSEKYKVTIAGEFPTLNEIIDASKSHYHAYNNLKQASAKTIKLKLQNANIPKLDKVYLKITYFRKNRRFDPDNIAAAKKFILDAMVAAGVIENDGWDQVAGWQESWKVDKQYPRIEIIIEEINND